MDLEQLTTVNIKTDEVKEISSACKKLSSQNKKVQDLEKLLKTEQEESRRTSLSIIFPPIFITFSVFISKFLKYFLTLFEQHMFYYLLDQLPVSYYHPKLHLLQQHFFLRVNNA